MTVSVLLALGAGRAIAQQRPAVDVSPPATVITTLDTVGNVGASSSVTIGADGLALISYHDLTNSDLKVAHCSNPACTAATITSLDTPGSAGAFTSVAIGADGLGLISYQFGGRLKVAHCENPTCTAATLTAHDTNGTGFNTSVAIGADGLGLITHFNLSSGDLHVTHCENVACTSATVTALDTTGTVGLAPSVTIGADGLGLISYVDYLNGNLKVAHCENGACTAATLTALDAIPPTAGGVDYATSVTTGTDGLGLIAFHDVTNGDLKVAHCENLACTTATLTAIDTIGIVGEDASVTIGADGLGLISYFDRPNADLKVAHCLDAACTAASITQVDTAGSVGYDPSVTTGVDGWGLISYYDGSRGDLKVAHCENAACLSSESPQAPGNLRVTSIVGNTVTIAWTPPMGPAPTSYVLEGGVAPGSVLASTLTGTTTPSYTFAAPTGSYHIRVHALAGASRSGPSNEIRIFVNVPGPPAAPTSVLGLVNASTVHLSWTNTVAGGPPTSLMLDVTGALAVSLGLPVSESFSYVGVPAGTYTFRLRAVNASGASPPSTPVTLTFPGACSGVPDVPVGFAATKNGSTITASWAPPTSAPAVTRYTLIVTGSFVGSFPTTGRALVGTVGPGNYTLSVRAENPCGSGAATATQTVLVP